MKGESRRVATTLKESNNNRRPTKRRKKKKESEIRQLLKLLREKGTHVSPMAKASLTWNSLRWMKTQVMRQTRPKATLVAGVIKTWRGPFSFLNSCRTTTGRLENPCNLLSFLHGEAFQYFYDMIVKAVLYLKKARIMKQSEVIFYASSILEKGRENEYMMHWKQDWTQYTWMNQWRSCTVHMKMQTSIMLPVMYC